MAEARSTGSLPVPNVQALAEACNGPDGQQVPERYLVLGAGSEAEKVVADSASAIPIIDLRRLLDPLSSPEECVKLATACHDWGFFQLVNHGLPDEGMVAWRGVAEFLKLPLETKKEWSKQPDSVEGYGQAFVVSEDQKLDWADMLYLVLHPTESRDLRFWPTLPASFRLSVDAFSSATRELAYRLLELMAKGVGADPALLRGVFQGQEARQGMRVNYYPPSKQADRVLGLLPHSDACGLTLLLQMNHDVHGLQVKKDGQWFPLHTLHGAFIVNVGDVLEVLSNGKFRSVEHRAVIHPTKERISVALFHYPCQDLMLAPLPELVRKGEKVWYGSMSFRDYLKQVYAAKLDGRKHLEGLKVGLASSYNIYGSRINVVHDSDYD